MIEHMYDHIMSTKPLASARQPVVLDGLEAATAEINVIAGHRNALDGRLVDIAVWLLDDDAWKGTGLRKPEQFLAFRCGLSPASARRYVQVAERADELPESIDALRRGELCLDQLMPIVRRVPGWADSQVLKLSKKLTVGQINAVINKYNFEKSGPPDDNPEPNTSASPGTEDDDLDEASLIATIDAARTGEPAPDEPTGDRNRTLVPKDRCWMGVGDDGRWRLHIETTAELGMAIGAAVDEARDRAFRESGNMISDAEALADIATRSLAATNDPGRRDRYRVNIHIETNGRATDHLGTPLPDVIAQHITCDGLISPVLLENGVPISVGRSQRIVPDRTRRVVLLRDAGCRVPGCGATHHLEVHHIVHWSDGGTTDTWNLVSLCAHHHRLHHAGQLGISGDADATDGLKITNAHGVDMNRDGPGPQPVTGPPPAPTGDYRPPLCERLDVDYVSFIHPERLALIAQQAREHAQRGRAERLATHERQRSRATERSTPKSVRLS